MSNPDKRTIIPGTGNDKILKRPEDCIYLSKWNGMMTCDYILIRHQPRGCDIGRKGCKRYAAGR